MSSRLTRLAALLAVVTLLGCGEGKGPPGSGGSGGPPGGAGKGPQAFPVEVAPVEARAVEYLVHATGTVDAFERVQVTARVSGAVESIRFSEGDPATSGQLLVEIEPRRFQFAAEAARASLEREDAALADAEAGLSRREAVQAKSPELVSGEELLTFRTRAASARAEAARGRAAAGQADLDLEYAFVRAPVAGIVETRTVQTGQWVQPGAVLATILRRDPLLLRFAVAPEDAARMGRDGLVRFRVPGMEGTTPARIHHVAGEADVRSRLVPVVAWVEGPPDRLAALRPGAFAEVEVPVGAREGAPVVPQSAVRPSERGFLAYIVDGTTAHERVVKLGMRTPDGLVEVREGVAVGEILVIRGAEALREGATVKLPAAPAPPGSESTLGTAP